METVEKVIKNKELTRENVMEVAAVAEKHLIVFEDISKELQKRCGIFVRGSLNISSVAKEFLKNEELDLDLFRKLVIHEDVPAIPPTVSSQPYAPVCSTCSDMGMSMNPWSWSDQQYCPECGL